MFKRTLAALLCLAMLAGLPGISFPGNGSGGTASVSAAEAVAAAGEEAAADAAEEAETAEEEDAVTVFPGLSYVTDGVVDKTALLPRNRQALLLSPSDEKARWDGAVRKSYSVRLPSEDDPDRTETFFVAAGPKPGKEPEDNLLRFSLDLSGEELAERVWAEDYRALQFGIAFEDAEGDFPLSVTLITSGGRLEAELTARPRSLEGGGIEYGRHLVQSGGGWSVVTLDLSGTTGRIEQLIVRIREPVFPVNTVITAPLLRKDPTDELIMAGRYASFSLEAGTGSFSFSGAGGLAWTDENGRLLLSGAPAVPYPVREGVPACFEVRVSGIEGEDAKLSVGLDYRDGLERDWSQAVKLTAGEELYAVPVQPLAEITAFSLLFEDLEADAPLGVDSVRIISGGSAVSSGNEWLGRLSRVERSGNEMVFAGSMDAEAIRAFSKSPLRFYAVPSPLLLSGDNEAFFTGRGSVSLPEGAFLIGETKISIRFENRYILPSPMPVNADACVFFACVPDPDAPDAVLLLSPPRYPDIKKTKRSSGASSVFGLADTFPAGVFESNAFHILTDVPLDEMLNETGGTSVGYTVPGESSPRAVFLDSALLSELDRDVTFYRTAGIAVYLRFRIDGPAAGLTAPGSLFPDMDSPASAALWCALVRFFVGRYPDATGLVLPGPVNDEDMMDCPAEEIGRAAEQLGHLGRLTWNAASGTAPGILICFPFDDRPETAAHSRIFMTLLCRRIARIGAYPWGCVYAAGADKTAQESLKRTLGSLEAAGPEKIFYIYQLSQSELDERYADYLAGEHGDEEELLDPSGLAAELYRDFAAACGGSTEAVFFSPALLEQRYDHDFYDVLKRAVGSGEDIQEFDVQEQALRPGMAVCDLWDFSDRHYPLDWIPGGGTLFCSTELNGLFTESLGSPSRVLSVSFQETEDGVAGIVMRNLDTSPDLTPVDALYFDFLLEAEGEGGDDDVSVVFITGTDDKRAEFHADGLRCGTIQRLSCPVAAWGDRDRVDFIAIAVYAETPVSLKLSKVSAVGSGISAEELKAVFAPAPAEETEVAGWLLPVLVFLLAGSSAVFVLLTRRDRDETDGGGERRQP